MNCREALHRNQHSSWTVIHVLLILYIHAYIFLISCIYLSYGVRSLSDITSCNHNWFAYFVTPNVAHMINIYVFMIDKI